MNYFKKHGMSGTRFYVIWKSMKGRCTIESNSGWKKYGKRGITISDSWNDFVNFMDDMYEKYLDHVKKHGEKDTFLNRINKKLLKNGYSKKNCEWVTMEKQANSRYKNGKKYQPVKRFSYNSEEITIKELSEKINVSIGAIHYRIKNGLDVSYRGNLKNKNPKRTFRKKRIGFIDKIINKLKIKL